MFQRDKEFLQQLRLVVDRHQYSPLLGPVWAAGRLPALHLWHFMLSTFAGRIADVSAKRFRGTSGRKLWEMRRLHDGKPGMSINGQRDNHKVGDIGMKND
jgi:hypothetical protein